MLVGDNQGVCFQSQDVLALLDLRGHHTLPRLSTQETHGHLVELLELLAEIQDQGVLAVELRVGVLGNLVGVQRAGRSRDEVQLTVINRDLPPL
eukprot:5454039-Pyramimonas_sp.AAC.1